MPDFLVEMAILPWLMAGAAVVKGIGDIYKSNKAKSRAKSKRRSTNVNIAKYEKGYLARNDLQQQYVADLKKRAKYGALPVGEMESQVSSRVGEQATQAKAGQVGFMASRGLEGSGVTASLTGRIDATSMQAIARAARAIRIQNEATKVSAEGELGREGRAQADVRRNLADRILAARTGRDTAYYEGMNRSDQAMGNAFSMPMDAMTAFASAGGFKIGDAEQASDGTWWQQMSNGVWRQASQPRKQIQSTPYTYSKGPD